MVSQSFSLFGLFLCYFLSLVCVGEKYMKFSFHYLWTTAHSACESGIILPGKHLNCLLFKKKKSFCGNRVKWHMSDFGMKLLKCYLTFISPKPQISRRSESSRGCQILSSSCSCFLASLSEVCIPRRENLHHHLPGQRRWPADIWFSAVFFLPGKSETDGGCVKLLNERITVWPGRENIYMCVCAQLVWWHGVFLGGS